MKKRKELQRLGAFASALILILALAPSTRAAEGERPVVRVAFPEQEGISQVDRSGRLSGYNYDYLEKISEFTGWKMDYVAYPSQDGNEAVGSAMNDLMSGKVDLMGPILKSAGAEEMFEFPQTSYGTVYTTLCADINSSLRKNDLNATRVLRIGLWEKAETRNREVEEFLRSEGIQGEIHYYDSAEAQLEALRTGKVDLISGVSLTAVVNTRILAKFAPRPYYFAATKGNTELVQQLDAAIQTIDEMQPELQDSLFDKYFLNAVNAFRLTDSQREALSQKKKLRVLCVDRDAPYVYQVEGQPRGALVMALNDFAEITGLTLEYTFCGSRSEAEARLEESEHYDLLIGMPFSSPFCAEKGYVRSEPVFTSGIALLRKSGGGVYEKETVGIIRGLEDSFDTTKFQDVALYDNARICIEALKAGKVDVAAGDRSVMEYYLYEDGASLAASPISGTTHEVGIAVCRADCLPILGILNNYIAALSTYQRTVYLDSGGMHSDDVTLARWIARNPVPAVVTLSLVAVLLVASILMVTYSTAMRKKDRLLGIATQAKDDFLSRMSHDIRTPLNGIIGLLKISEDHPEDENLQTENRQKMAVAARHLLSLVNDVLEMSKLEDGVEGIESVPTDLNDVARSIVSELREDALESGIKTQYEGPDRLTYPYVMGSPNYLRQIFRNIYGNCIKFTKTGGTITTRFECLGKAGNKVTYRWTISDTGIGMSEEYVKHIFEPFSQEHTGARTEYQGTGLGMAIVKELVEKMDGTVTVSSRKGVGTTFVITLPFALTEPGQLAHKPASIAGLHILMAEDNELNAEIAEILLADQGAQVTTVVDGAQAVEQIRDNPAGTYDAVLMDIMMPVMDGLEATRAIRSLNRPDAETIPILAMTANAFEDDAEKCRQAGMNAHLTKPIEIDKVVAAIARYSSAARQSVPMKERRE